MEGNKTISIKSKLSNEENVYSAICMALAFSIILLPALNSILSAGLFLYWLIFSKKHSYLKWKNKLWSILFCSLFLLVLIGLLYSTDLRQALSRVEKKAPLLFFPLIFSNTTISVSLIYKRVIKAFVIATFIGCFICIAYGAYQYFLIPEKAEFYGYNLIILKQMSPAVMSFCCLIALLFLFQNFYEFQKEDAGTGKWVLPVIMAILIFIFILLLGNRVALAVAAFLFLFYVFKLIRKKSYRFIAIFSLGILIVTTTFFNPYLQRQLKDLTDFSQNNSIVLDKDASLGRSWGGKALRITIWKCSWDIIKNNWFIGVGTGDVQNSLQDAYEKRKFYFASRYNRYDAHNQYIQQTLSNGIIGLFVFLCCILMPLMHFILQKQNLVYCLFILCFAIACMTESLLEVSKGVILYSLFNSLLFFKNQNNLAA